MPGMHTLIQNISAEVVLDSTDIGGTTATSKYLDMANFGSVDFLVQLGTTLEGTPDGWSATDSLDNFYIVQATDSSGSDVKIVAGANLDQTDAQTGTAGDIYTITVHSDQLDVANNFTHMAALVVEDTGTGTDTVTIVGMRYNPRYSHEDLTSAKHTVG